MCSQFCWACSPASGTGRHTLPAAHTTAGARRPASTLMDMLHLTISNDVAEFARVASEVSSFLEKCGVPEGAGFRVHLVIEELVRNVQLHAFGEDRPDGVIDLEVKTSSDSVWVHVEDDGPPFDPTAGPDPDVNAPLAEREEGGLGVYLVRQMTEEVSYQRARNRNRVSVRIAVAG